MYKNDSMAGGCNDALLRMMMEGRSPSCPVFENGKESCGNAQRPQPSGTEWGVRGYPLASVYAPLQDFEELYDEDTALKQGTVFKELDLPFLGDKRIIKGGNCRG